MKIDLEAVQVGCAVLVPVSALFFYSRRRFCQVFALFLAGFALLELILMWGGFGEGLWWTIHLPSTMILGDEILERHGVWISTIAHLADLVLWSTLGSIPVAFRFGTSKERNVP